MKNTCLQSMAQWRRCLEQLDFARLPGLDAQLRMAPEMRHQDIRSRGVGRDAIKSSVLFLFYPSDQGIPSTVLIQRPEYDGAHSGQISFPGGRYEPDDKDLLQTALRETHEEIGIDTSHLEVIGKLTDLYIPPSNYIVSTYLALSDQTPYFSPDPAEVASIIEVPLSALFDPGSCYDRKLTLRNGYQLTTPCFTIDGHIIWGATAMIMAEFMAMVDGQCTG